VRYFDVDVPAVAVGRVVHFPMRALCQVLGIAPQMQVQRLRADSRFAGALQELPIPTVKGLRQAVCIKKQQVGPWLATIDPARCALAARGPIERFQRELFDAADRFLFGDLSTWSTTSRRRAARRSPDGCNSARAPAAASPCASPWIRTGRT